MLSGSSVVNEPFLSISFLENPFQCLRLYVHRSSNSVSRLFKYTQTTQVRCPCRSVCCDASIVRHKNVDVHVVRFNFLSAMIKNTYIYRFNLKVRTRNRTDCRM